MYRQVLVKPNKNLMEIHSEVLELLLADTGADMMKLIGAFLQLSVTNAPKNN
jgi:hypothetical protein